MAFSHSPFDHLPHIFHKTYFTVRLLRPNFIARSDGADTWSEVTYGLREDDPFALPFDVLDVPDLPVGVFALLLELLDLPLAPFDRLLDPFDRPFDPFDRPFDPLRLP